MKTINKKVLFITALLFSLTGFKKTKTDDDLQTILTVVGGAALGSFVLYKLIQSGVFNKSEQQIIDDAYQNIHLGIKYSEITVLEQFYDINRLSDFERRTIINKINEGILYGLSKGVFRYSSTINYLNELNSVISNIKSSRNEIKNALKKPNAKSYDLNSLLTSIDNILPKIEFLYSYIDNHKSYFELCKITNEIDKKFEKELNLLNSQNISYNDFKWIIRNEGNKLNAKYPFINYVKRLTENIDDLSKAINNLSFRYPNLSAYANDIKNKLNSILDNAIADAEYSKENLDIENERIKKAELELKEKEYQLKQQMEYEKLALKQREIEAREREVLAKEKEAKLRERELYWKQFEDKR